MSLFENQLTSIEKGLKEASESQSGIAERAHIDILRKRQADVAKVLLQEKVRLLEFIGDIVISLGIEKIHLYDRMPIDYISFSCVDNVVRMSYKDPHRREVCISSDIGKIITENYFPFRIIYAYLIERVSDKLEANNIELKNDADFLTKENGTIRRIAKRLMDKVPAASPQ